MTRPLTATALALALAAAAPAAAHEFVVLPAETRATAGEAIGFEVHSTHVFFAPEEMERPESVSVELVSASGPQPVEIAAGADGLMLTGEVETGAETVWLAAHRLGQIWSKTPNGWVEAGRDEATDAEFTNKYEKFAKVLINAGDAAVATAPIGQLLEIVPLSDPSELAPGDVLEVRVLHDGQPVDATVTATFGGFSDLPNTYAYLTETREVDGTPQADIKTWSPGLWVVRAELQTADTPGIDAHVLRSILQFEVN
ncbi:MAG: DUF4198 domain-containing protein [Paracoccaceae bacterium]